MNLKKMMTASVVLIMIATMTTQAQVFQKGSNMIGLGVGLGSSLGSFSYGSNSPALSLQYEKGVWDIGGPGVVSLGGYLGFKNYKYSGESGDFSYSEKWNYTIIGIRSAYHYTGLNSDKLDVYGGLMLSYNILSYSYKDNTGEGNKISDGNYGSAAGLTIYLGGRYFFSDHIAAFAELGYGVSYLTLGLAFKF
jgi:hypothetical protein